MRVNTNVRAIALKLDTVGRGVSLLTLNGLLCFSCVFTQAADADRISTFAQLYSLSPEKLAQGQPVHIDTTVLCFDADWGQLFVDSSPTGCTQTFSQAMPFASLVSPLRHRPRCLLPA
jgi:hypothetical protein